MDASEQTIHAAHWHDRLQDSVDGALGATDRILVESHLNTCEACRVEHANLTALHSLLGSHFGVAPALSADFSTRVLTGIDEAEEARRAAAKLQAERDFQKRLRAFELDWRSLWQRHMGSIIAGVTTVAAVSAMLGASWASLRGQLLNAFPSLAVLVSTPSVAMFLASLVISASAFLYLRSKAH